MPEQVRHQQTERLVANQLAEAVRPTNRGYGGRAANRLPFPLGRVTRSRPSPTRVDAELRTVLGRGQIGTEAVDGRQQRHADREEQRRRSFLLDASRRVVRRELDQVALLDARHAAVVYVDRLVRDRVQAFATQPDDMHVGGVGVGDAVDELPATGIPRFVASDVYPSLGRRLEQGDEAVVDGGELVVMQADADAGYNQLYASGRVTEIACWTHFRRKIFDIHQARPTALTTDLLDRIAALYAVEATVRGQPPDQRRAARQDRSVTMVDALRVALDDVLRRPSPKSEMAKAISYGVELWPALVRFLDDGCLEIDNNIAERAIRGIAVGRRNWLFAGSNVGGERAAAIYTVIETCKANGVDPQAYIADATAGIANDWPASRWNELMPWSWKGEGYQQVAEAG